LRATQARASQFILVSFPCGEKTFTAYSHFSQDIRASLGCS
jgi:hypothetical protein